MGMENIVSATRYSKCGQIKMSEDGGKCNMQEGGYAYISVGLKHLEVNR